MITRRTGMALAGVLGALLVFVGFAFDAPEKCNTRVCPGPYWFALVPVGVAIMWIGGWWAHLHLDD